MPDKVNLTESFARFDARWAPRIVGELNGQHVKIAKFEGAFVWHRHTGDVEEARTVEAPERL